MRVSILIVCSLLPLLGACSSVKIVRLQTIDTHRQLSKINLRGSRDNAVVLLNTGETWHAENLRVDADSTSWFNAAFADSTRVSTFEIGRITFIRRGRGALEGFGLGLLAGASLGALVGYASGDDPPEGFIAFRAGEKAALFGGVLGVVGGLVGLLAGASTGHRDIFNFGAAGAMPKDLRDHESSTGASGGDKVEHRKRDLKLLRDQLDKEMSEEDGDDS